MATVEVLIGVSDLADLILRLFPRGDDTPANGSGDPLTEQTNRRGCYRATIEEELVGVHEAYVLDADSNILFTGAVLLSADAGVHTVGELGDVPVSTRARQATVDAMATDVNDLEERLTAERAENLDNLSRLDVSVSSRARQTTVEQIAEAVDLLDDLIATIAEDVWSHGDRRLTVSGVSSSSVDEHDGELTLLRGDTLAITLSGLGDLSGRQQLWFTLKSKRSDPDTSAILLVEETDGLLVLAGTEPGDGETTAITVEDMESDAVTIVVSAAASRKLAPTTTGVWDLQVRDADGNVRTLVHGAAKITADVTQRIE